jgi:ATP-dependent Clp protease ATP-binding subunit ClpC
VSPLSNGADLVWKSAVAETQQARLPRIEPEHLFIGVCSLERFLQPGAIADAAVRQTVQNEWAPLAAIFQNSHLDPAAVRRALRAVVGTGTASYPDGLIHRSDASKAVFDRAGALAELTERPATTSMHLLQALLEQDGTFIPTVLSEQGVQLGILRAAVIQGLAPPPVAPPAPPTAQLSSLEQFGRDLTRLAAEGKLPPVVGRRTEMLAVVRILSQVNKPNVVLVGEPGVGKTAVVEGLAQRIADGKNLPGQRLIELSLEALVSGTQYRGAFEERITRVLEEARAHPEVILFIDEIHKIVSGGAAEGGLDVANMLKPALARGDVRVIGATTIKEYRRYLERDEALARRFRTVQVPEPTPEEAREMLGRLRDRYQMEHGVTIDDAALDAAIELTIRYLPDRRLPDKAKDVLDTACTWVTVPALSTSSPNLAAPTRERVTRELIADVVSSITGIPAVDVLKPDAALLRLEEALRARVIGQDEAVTRVANRIRINRVGLGDPNRPIGVFLFLGPTGVGKTELAKALAEVLFHAAGHLIRLDMSELQQRHDVSKLIGAPPGYLGHGEEGLLTGKLRTHPYSVVLLDEVEKAHPDVFDLFLQVFDEGRLTDATGKAADARHAIFIMTSNLLPPPAPIPGLDLASPADEDDQLAELRRHFRPEFLNRIDEIIVFRPLGSEQIAEIVRQHLEATRARARERWQIELDLTPEAVALLARKGYDERRGARELKRVIAALLLAPLAEQILAEALRPGDAVRVELASDRLRFVAALNQSGAGDENASGRDL